MKTRQVLAGRGLALALALALWPVAGMVAGPVYYVRAGGLGAGTGTSWANATGDLQWAIEQVAMQKPGEVWVAAGT